jgi:hypothetical protein
MSEIITVNILLQRIRQQKKEIKRLENKNNKLVDRLNEKMPSINDCIYIKDFCRISDVSYQKMINVFGNLRSLGSLKSRMKVMNESFEVKSLEKGFYIEPIERIKSKIVNLIQKNEIKYDEIIEICFSCDGTIISRSISCENLIFSVKNQKVKSTTAYGKRILII